MRASLDTNVIIHFYRAGLQEILFDFFEEGVFIYEQIRKIELVNHAQIYWISLTLILCQDAWKFIQMKS